MLDGAVDATETLAFNVFFFPGDPIIGLSGYLSAGSPAPFEIRSVLARYLFMLLLPRFVPITFLSFSA
jgi:hypothetical protein